MKRTLLLWSAALCFACFGLVSCHDEEPTPNPDQNQGQNETPIDSNTMDLSQINFMDHGWTLTEISCDEISSNLLTQYQAALFRNDGSLYLDPYGNPAAADNKYSGWDLNIILNHVCEFSFYVESFSIKDGKPYLEISTDNDMYDGFVNFSQDAEKVYITYTGESWRSGNPTIFSGYQLKSKF